MILTKTLSKKYESLLKTLPNLTWKPSEGFIWNYLELDESSDLSEITLNRRLAFAQVNAAQNERMRQWLAKELASINLNATDTIIELFCGSGNFTEIVARQTNARIIALEVDAKATKALTGRNFANVEIKTQDLFRVKASSFGYGPYANSKIIIANPPRAGLGRLAGICRYMPELEVFIYISCNPASFAHDAKKILRSGFHLQSLQPLDQMPQTPHVELCAVFKHNK